jgi:hypothetical protein
MFSPVRQERKGTASAMPRTSSHKMNCHPERSEEPALSLSKGPMQLAYGTLALARATRNGSATFSHAARRRYSTTNGGPISSMPKARINDASLV